MRLSRTSVAPNMLQKLTKFLSKKWLLSRQFLHEVRWTYRTECSAYGQYPLKYALSETFIYIDFEFFNHNIKADSGYVNKSVAEMEQRQANG